jgi:hypothetical protein
MRTFVSAFQDAHLGTGHHEGIPFIQDETAQSHLFRIIDFLNLEIWDDPSASGISREVILTLLQCAARLYEGGAHTKEAVDLIKNEDTRAILSLGIQDNLSQVIHQRCVESIRSNKSEATSTENYSQQAGLFSAIRKIKARRLNHQAMIIEHISALCRSQGAALQNTFDCPGIDEEFMFRNYITLSKALNVCEKSWLVTLLPDIFQWESQDSCGDVNGLNDALLPPSLTAIEETNRHVGANASETMTSPQEVFVHHVIQGANQKANTPLDVPASLDVVDYAHQSSSWSPGACNNASSSNLVSPPSQDSGIISDEVQGCTALDICKNIQEAFGFVDASILELLRKRAVTYRNLASVEAVTSVPKAASEFRDQAEKEDASNHHKAIKDGAASPSDDNAVDGNWNLLESDDDSEYMFSFSPPARNDASNAKPVLTHLPRSADTLGTELCGHIPAANPGNQGRDYRTGRGLTPISEEFERQREAGEKRGRERRSYETELHMTDPAFPELPCALHQEKLVEVRNHLNVIRELGWDEFWKKAGERDLIPADLFATVLWMAEVVKTFGISSEPTSTQLTSVQLSPGSVELALQYSRGAPAAEIIPRIRGQLKSILGETGVTETEFLRVVKTFAIGLDNAEITKIPCQMAYWFGKDEEYKALLLAFVPVKKNGPRVEFVIGDNHSIEAGSYLYGNY